jgi:uncharacterized protein (DUF362 family)
MESLLTELRILFGRLELNPDSARGPLSGLIQPGETVVLKPNWVRQSHEERPEEWDYVVTHPAVIEAVATIVIPALAGKGRIVIIDGPQNDSSFKELSRKCDFPGLLSRLRALAGIVKVDLIDLRDQEDTVEDGIVVSRLKLPGDPLGSCHVALDDASEFVGYAGLGKLYGAAFNTQETNERHAGTTHHYMVSKTIITADVVINLPKLKTHKKAGITCSLKNMVGINTRKNWLPHHTQGTPNSGGDQFPQNKGRQRIEATTGWMLKPVLGRNLRLAQALVPLKNVARRFFGDTRKVVRSGNWWGNQTIWRMVLDLNKVLLYAAGDGAPARKEKRRYLSVVDGIVGGEGDGPMAPDRVESRLLLAGTNPVAVDCCAAKLMRLDFRKIPACIRAFSIEKLPLVDFAPQEIRMASNEQALNGLIDEIDTSGLHPFRPHFGWIGKIEETEVARNNLAVR